MFKIRVFVLVVMGISFLMAYSQSTNSIKRDSTITKSRLAEGVKLSEVEVVGNKKFGLESSQMSAIQLSQQQIKLVPMFMGTPDVLKALQKLPGVNSEGEGTVGISVRGGNIDQNLITLDGATLYNPEHLKGYASAINPDMVGNIDFYRGAFPARYGSRLSSVIDVTMKEGDFKKYHGSLFLGALSGSAMIEGPIWKNHTSFCVGGRMSYFDLLAYPALEKVYDNPDKLLPYSEMKYFDINAKITHKFSERNRLSASFYYGKDNDNTTPTDGVYEKITVLKYAYMHFLDTGSDRRIILTNNTSSGQSL
jgi:outer membrane receptor for ferrienterochelin and colicin